MNHKNISVFVPLPIFYPLTYKKNQDKEISCGARVSVSVKGKVIVGIVSDKGEEFPKEEKIIPINKVLDEKPILTKELYNFILKAADYYFCPPGIAFETALPSLFCKPVPALSIVMDEEIDFIFTINEEVRDKKELNISPQLKKVLALFKERQEIGWKEIRKISKRPSLLVSRAILNKIIKVKGINLSSKYHFENGEFTLSPAQIQALKLIEEAIYSKRYRGFLIHGVTGSGKTEIYIQTIAKVLNLGKRALVLVPEISLTPQLVERFKKRFGDNVIAVLHSGLREKERAVQWWLIREGFKKIVIGARSAIFSPISNLGVIVVDEEHDTSYKQEEGFRYNARDMALLRAKINNCVAILGSATPSFESYSNIGRDKLKLIELPERVTPQKGFPEITIVDMKKNLWGAYKGIITVKLKQAIDNELRQGHQVILFLNRRGFAPIVLCENCGEPVTCRDCSVSVTYHKSTNSLQCHYCGGEYPMIDRCPICMSEKLRLLGRGTEQIEQIIKELYPEKIIKRLDRDLSPKKVVQVINELRKGEIDIVIGTQMITKGHDIPNITIVGVVLADISLHLPDFRSSERTFQLLTQVAGRAGRGEYRGKVIIQSFQPEHPAIKYASLNRYKEFYETEIKDRGQLGYPPFSYLTLIGLSGPKKPKVIELGEYLSNIITSFIRKEKLKVELLGPAPAPIFKLRGNYRYRLLLRSPDRNEIRKIIKNLLSQFPTLTYGSIKIIIDIDPYNLL